MSRPNRLRARVAGLEGVRQLADGEAAVLLADPSLTINEPVTWRVAPGQEADPAEVRMSVQVFNQHGERLSLRGRIELRRPESSHWLLIWGDKAFAERPVNLRRLDLRDRHRNPDGQLWDFETHKHTWSASEGNDWAYTPSDIPHGSGGDHVGGDNYRAVFEAFIAECGISLGPDYAWHEPTMEFERRVTLLEVP